MALTGELVSLVLIPRFTTYVGAGDFTSVLLDVAAFASVSVLVARGPLLGTTPSCDAFLEASEDGDVWSALDHVVLSSSSSATLVGTITRRFLRIRINLSASDSAVTCWCGGALVRRVP